MSDVDFSVAKLAEFRHQELGVDAGIAPADFVESIVFFDLAGTLIEPDARLSERRKHELRRFSAFPRRIVLVTGQSSDDPQVQEISRLFVVETAVEFSAYVTRGGLRLVKRGANLEPDPQYALETRLDESLQGVVREAIGEVLSRTDLQPLFPVKCVDDVAMRVNLAPGARLAFTAAMKAWVAQSGLSGLQVVAEGRTSVFVMRREVGKRKAVLFELDDIARQFPRVKAYYFGNEFHEGGNDREVSDISNLRLMALGDAALVPHKDRTRIIGQSPDDLYAFIGQTMKPACETTHKLPVVFVSLGGTKFQFGALTRQSERLTTDEIKWRGEADFMACLRDENPSPFCDALARRVGRFLRENGCDWADVCIVGMGFPGPCTDGRWQSFNLTRAFGNGVELGPEFDRAVRRLATVSCAARTRVVFDAQCDAGGEVYHPLGRLYELSQGAPREEAVVINVATGIAAGFVKSGMILITDDDFANGVFPGYDAGAGQIGRHLWYRRQERQWEYHYCPRGGIPSVDGAIRMTEYLSGPALAARLLLRVGESDSLPRPEEWQADAVELDEVLRTFGSLVNEPDPVKRSQHLRQGAHPLSSAVLRWADQVYGGGRPAAAARCIGLFAQEVADDFAAALRTWAAAPGWEPFLRRVVLTGGVGLHFLASADSGPAKSFLAMLMSALPGQVIQRSRLTDSAERGAYLFRRQPE